MSRDLESIEDELKTRIEAQAAHFGNPSAEPAWYAIPNWLNWGITLSFFVFAAFVAMPLHTVLWHAGSAAAVLLAMVLFMQIGGGAAKLTAAIILWLGFPAGAVFVALSYLSCGLTGYLARAFGRKSDAMPYLPFALASVAAIAAAGGLPQELHF